MTDQANEIIGDWQQPVNKWAALPGSIHNDDVASKIGMRGGTIPGTVHLDHFVPLIKAHFGIAWFTAGSISMYYTYATTDREDVRAVMNAPSGASNEQVTARIETPQGQTVAKGTLAVGTPDELPYVRSIPFENAAADDVRILAALKAGDSIEERGDVRVDDQGESGDYAGLVTRPSVMFTMLQGQFPRDRIEQAVGFYGGTEIQLHNGPIRADTPYRTTGRIACINASPKTEMIYVDTMLHEQASGKLVATCRKLTRFMKAGAPVWNS